MWTLYGSRGSGSAAVELALARCGVDSTVRRASTWEKDSDQAGLKAVNPLGQIPTLVTDDGGVLTESAAILIELGLRFPASGLLPADHAARAQAIRGLVYLAANCYAAIGVIDYPERWCSACDQPVQARIREGTRARLHHLWEVFADQFPVTTPYLGGDRPGALDFLAVVISRWGGARAHLRQARPALLERLERAEAHPDVTPVIARHWPPKS